MIIRKRGVHAVAVIFALVATESAFLHQRQHHHSSTSLWAKKKKGGGSAAAVKGFGAPKINIETDRSETARQFYEYLDRNQVSMSTSLGFFDGLRGVVALIDIPKGEAIIDIPYELAINLGPQGEDPVAPAIEFLRDYCAVMSQGGDRQAYYKMLPAFRTDCLSSTDFFDDSALEALQYPMIADETRERRKKVVASFDQVKDLKWIDGSEITLEHLQWAVWLITSRVLTVQGDESSGKAYRLLIPYLDMCNHDRESPHILTGRAVPGGRLKVVAGKKVKAGQQVNICYGGGVAGNDRFIQDYGFLDDTETAYDITAQQLMGKRRIQEGAKAGKSVLQTDRERTLECLGTTSSEEDSEAAKKEQSLAMRSALQFRIGIKKALKKLKI